MTLAQILELAREARKSPHARRVLHDALLEHYGERYERILARAQTYADSFDSPQVILFRPRHAESFYGGGHELAGSVFGTVDIADFRSWRRWKRTHYGPHEVVTLLVVRPRRPA